jgi:ABC-type uncharacterized transport system substrate-binding protein
MRRRQLLALVGAGFVLRSPIGRAQQPTARKIGMLMAIPDTDPEGQPRVAAFGQALQKLGWIEGHNIRMAYRWTGDPNLMRRYAQELVRLSPDVIVAASNPALAALREATRTVPIVFVTVADPVAGGFVDSLARPRGNITGFTNFEPSIAGKWIELIKEIAPGLTRVAAILHPETDGNVALLRAAQAAAPLAGVTLTAIGVHDASDIERGLAAFTAEGNGGLIVVPHPITASHRGLILRLADRGRLATIAAWRYFAADGALISYGIDMLEQYRRAASYVDRILRGEKPGNLPVQAPTKFELVINLKTAKALGFEVPLHLQQLADEVIE